jgi:predicted amino acid racemase
VISGTRVFYDDIRIYRMAEAYMFKAEIENALDNKDAAITNLNIVAKRAYKVDNYYPLTLTKEQADSVILAERLQEFVAEGKSWFDIIRFGKAFEIITTLIGRETDKQGNILLFPVNVDVISRNSTKITQTPGY